MSVYRNAVVTGASQGVGKAVAQALAKDGFRLWLSARNEEKLVAVAKTLPALANNHQCHAIDMQNTTEVQSYAGEILRHATSIDVLVNNVGIYLPDTVTDGLVHLDEQLKVNFLAPLTLTQGLMDIFKKQRHGHIINILSVVNRQPRPSAASYTISKFAFHGYHRLLHESLKPLGVKVTALFPSSINTPSWGDSDVPRNEFVQPNDIAALICTLVQMDRGTVPDEIDLSSINPNY